MNPRTFTPVDLRSPSEEYAMLLECRIGGRVRELRVQVVEGNRIILSGRTHSYYARRVAHQIASEFLGDEFELANEIVVC